MQNILTKEIFLATSDLCYNQRFWHRGIDKPVGDVVEKRISTDITNVNLNQTSLTTIDCVAKIACQSSATWQGLYRRDAMKYTLSERFPISQSRLASAGLMTSIPTEAPTSLYIFFPFSSHESNPKMTEPRKRKRPFCDGHVVSQVQDYIRKWSSFNFQD